MSQLSASLPSRTLPTASSSVLPASRRPGSGRGCAAASVRNMSRTTSARPGRRATARVGSSCEHALEVGARDPSRGDLADGGDRRGARGAVEQRRARRSGRPAPADARWPSGVVTERLALEHDVERVAGLAGAHDLGAVRVAPELSEVGDPRAVRAWAAPGTTACARVSPVAASEARPRRAGPPRAPSVPASFCAHVSPSCGLASARLTARASRFGCGEGVEMPRSGTPLSSCSPRSSNAGRSRPRGP